MNIAPSYFVSLGHDYYVDATKVVCVTRVDTVQARKIKTSAVAREKYMDYTYAHATKSYVILDDATVLGCALTPGTICKRLNSAISQFEEANLEWGSKSSDKK